MTSLDLTAIDPAQLIGQWKLNGFYVEEAGHVRESMTDTFRNVSAYSADKFASATGESLDITESDGEITYRMRGEASVLWTSAEKEQGVLESNIEDQDGRFGNPHSPLLSMERLVEGEWVSAYSDSDLDMDNVVFVDGAHLVLLVTTIVDELYVTKYFYRFSRV